jgi:RNA polymerase sigma-70 factor (ECF subfamily)
VQHAFSLRLLAELKSLLRVARQLTRSDADAEDLVQATVVRAIERHDELRDRERMRPWLLQIQRTVFLNGRRGLARKLELVRGDFEGAEPTADLEVEFFARLLPDELDGALRKLAPEIKDTFLLREVEGLSYEEIATIQACPVGTVRSRLARARLTLFELLSNRDTPHANVL